MKAVFSSVTVAIIGALFLWHSTDGFQALTTEGARRIAIAEHRPELPDVTLETMAGEREPLLQDGKKAVLAEFIYTTCPTICQTSGAELARLRNLIVDENMGDRVRIISISFDPETDEPAQLAYYGNRHDADGKIWTVTRPSPGDLPDLLEKFGVLVIPDGYGGYEHNAAMHVVSPDGRLSAIVDTDDITGAVAELKKVLQ